MHHKHGPLYWFVFLVIYPAVLYFLLPISFTSEQTDTPDHQEQKILNIVRTNKLTPNLLLSALKQKEKQGEKIKNDFWKLPPVVQVMDLKKPIVLLFGTPSCRYCKQIKHDILSEEFAKIRDTYHFIYIDATAEPYGVKLKRTYDLQVVPTLVWLDAYGREVDRQAGYGGKEKLSARMHKNSKGEDALEKLFTKYLEDKADAEPILSIAEIRMDQMKVQEATFLLNSTSPQQLTSPATQARYDFLMGRAHYLKSDFKKASDYLLDYIKSDYAEEEGTALRWLEKCSKRLDQSQLIYDAYEIVIQKDPEDFHTMNSFAWSASQEKIHLDKALPYAKKAVELSEHSPGILDTLAEVYYALGELEQAIATEKLALEKDPKEKEFQNRILKYEQALKSKSSSKTVTQ